MKVYKSEPDEYGWYCVVHKNKNGNLKIFKKCIRKDRRKYEDDIQIWGEDVKLLKKAIMDKTK